MLKKIKNSILLKAINVAYKKGRLDGFYECRNNGYEVAFANGLKQGRADERREILEILNSPKDAETIVMMLTNYMVRHTIRDALKNRGAEE